MHHALMDCDAVTTGVGGSNKTLMVVTMAPTAAAVHESLCSLRFAAKVSTVIRGQAKKHTAAIPK